MIERLEKIENAVRQLQRRCVELEEENLTLVSERTRFQELIKSKDAQINNLEEQNKITKLAEGLASTKDRNHLKAQIDELIQEVDQCIKLVKK